MHCNCCKLSWVESRRTEEESLGYESGSQRMVGGQKEWQLEPEYQEVGKVWGSTWGALWCWMMHLGLERKMERVEGFGEVQG